MNICVISITYHTDYDRLSGFICFLLAPFANNSIKMPVTKASLTFPTGPTFVFMGVLSCVCASACKSLLTHNFFGDGVGTNAFTTEFALRRNANKTNMHEKPSMNRAPK